MPRIITWGAGLAAGCVGGLFYSGKIGYTPTRSPEWIEAHLQQLPQISQLARNPQFVQTHPWNTNSSGERHILDVPGGVSPPVVFVDKKEPGHTVAATYCGSKTCGWPFLVHGGVLGTLIEEAMNEAAQHSSKSGWHQLRIVYRQPTLVGQFLIIETGRTVGGELEAVVKNSAGKTLVEALAQ